ncbi:MAG: coproporphyrinogen III oxidase, partial [Burkholderiales bacterium]|nr:coproporphyrinogen III oxidase [Burkholderiales bacterium]
LLRRAVIMALMCQGRVDFEAIELAHLIKMRDYFASELEQLAPLVDAGLVQLEPDAIQVTAAGWYVVRAVAALFDRYLQGDRLRERYSRII